jgi:hypothetical protein
VSTPFNTQENKEHTVSLEKFHHILWCPSEVILQNARKWKGRSKSEAGGGVIV